MRLLLIKLSSLGDVVHTLPALTDAHQALPHLEVTWVIEEAYQQIPLWHPAVVQVIPVALRRWRRGLLQAWRSGEWRQFRRQVQQVSYDRVLDAQGLLKSAGVAAQARGLRLGLDRHSAREPVASLLYQRTYSVAWGQHAVLRLRQLLAQALDYPLPQTPANFGLTCKPDPRWGQQPYLVFLHGTAWMSKQWPHACWQELITLARAAGFQVLLPWGNAAEQARATALAAGDDATVLPRLSLSDLAGLLAGAAGVVGVDTGLLHLAAALGRPGVGLYGATSPALTGALGPRQCNLQATWSCAPCVQRQCHQVPAGQAPPCYRTLPPAQVWARLQAQMATRQLLPPTERPTAYT